jgi:hypothetical protein
LDEGAAAAYEVKWRNSDRSTWSRRELAFAQRLDTLVPIANKVAQYQQRRNTAQESTRRIKAERNIYKNRYKKLLEERKTTVDQLKDRIGHLARRFIRFLKLYLHYNNADNNQREEVGDPTNVEVMKYDMED